jgi:hypothetical protein
MNRNLGTNITQIKFKNTHTVYEKFIKCTVKDYEYNLSYNPTLLSGSQGRLVPYSSSVGSNVIYVNPTGSNFGILKDFVTGSNSGSYFSPYVTTIGLYNDAQELLMIGKMAMPIPLSDTTDTTFLIKYDMDFVSKVMPLPSITPTPSLTPSITPSITVSPSVTPSITITPSVTPSLTPSASVTPSVTVSPAPPSVTPSVTPTITPTVTPTVTPSITPSITATPSTTPSVPLYDLNFYGRLGASPSADNATIYYSLDNSTWYPIATPIDSNSCILRETLSFSNGTTVYISLRNSSGTFAIGFNAATGTTCPANSNVYCDYSPFSLVMSGNKDVALTAYVTPGGSGLFIAC